jgi:hypothetical protein
MKISRLTVGQPQAFEPVDAIGEQNAKRVRDF